MSTGKIDAQRSLLGQGRSRRNRIIALAAAVLVAIILYTLIISRAATNFVSVDPSGSTISGNAQVVTESDGTKSILFKAPATTPPPTTPPPTNPPVSGWPNATNVGILGVSTTRTMNGANIDSTSWFAANGFTGSGTEADPYLVSKVRFTDQVFMLNMPGKWVKFDNCRFLGDPTNPTVGGTGFLKNRDSGPFFTIEDSTLGPDDDSLLKGDAIFKIGGVDHGVESYVPFRFLRNNIFGAAIPVYFETERNETTGVVVQDNYIHDVWSADASADHTDLVNGNFHASHVTIRHNYLDGIRNNMGSKGITQTYVTNGIGIYDDPGTSAGIIEDWTIDNNYFDRSARFILSNNDTSRVRDPFVVTNNTFTNRWTVDRTSMRKPSTQSGNVDQNGAALTFN